MRSSHTWRPDERTRRSESGVEVVYLIGETEGAYRLEADGYAVTVYPSKAVTTLKRRRIIDDALAEPDPLAAVLGALILGGVRAEEIEVERR